MWHLVPKLGWMRQFAKALWWKDDSSSVLALNSAVPLISKEMRIRRVFNTLWRQYILYTADGVWAGKGCNGMRQHNKVLTDGQNVCANRNRRVSNPAHLTVLHTLTLFFSCSTTCIIFHYMPYTDLCDSRSVLMPFQGRVLLVFQLVPFRRKILLKCT